MNYIFLHSFLLIYLLLISAWARRHPVRASICISAMREKETRTAQFIS